MSSHCKLFISGAIVEVGISSDDSSGNKRKLGGSAAATTGDIADSKLRQKANTTSGTLQVSKSDQLANNKKGSLTNSLANPTTKSPSTGSQAQASQAHSTGTAESGEAPAIARFKIGTTGELAQEGSVSPRFTDPRQGVTSHEELGRGKGEHHNRSLTLQSSSHSSQSFPSRSLGSNSGPRLPNSSFLWAKKTSRDSDSHDGGDRGEDHHWQSKALAQQEIGEGSVLDDTEFYDDVGVPNYQVIRDYNKNDPLNHSYMDITSARYLEMGKSTISNHGSYDDIRAPDLPSSSRIYLSADNLSLVQYDDIKARERVADEAMCLDQDQGEEEEELHNSALVTATPCVVLEEQADSLNYVYDDIGRREEDGEMGLYESIAGSLLNLARVGTGSSDAEDFALGRRFSRGAREPHEVVNYSLSIFNNITIVIDIVIVRW